MFNSILIVEHSPFSFKHGSDVASVSAGLGCSRRTSWETFAPDQLRSGQDSLLIANAVPGTDKATAFFRWLRQNPIPIPVFAILPEQDGALLQAAAEIVDDFLLWPVRPRELDKRITRLLGPAANETISVPASLAAEIGMEQLVGQDPAFRRVRDQIKLFSGHDIPVMITGETGTGKELCARMIHLSSKRHQGPFIPVDCGALPDHLFENEVFGHTRGAFTDARSDQKGLVALAQHGTLFMDEIDSLSVAAQSKVLRLLQEHIYRPLGSETFKKADVRIIAATNRSLEDLVVQKQFRSDLFFRINVLRIRLPALRDRRSDISLLSRHFIDEVCRAAGVSRKVLSLAAARKLEEHDWPGNVRELHNILQRAVLYSPGTQIAASVVDLNAPGETDQGAAGIGDFRSAKLHAIECFERDYVQQIMNKHEGNVTRAAREAGKERRAFGRLAKKYHIGGMIE